MPATAPHYFLNVPQLLERMRRGVDEQIAQKGGIAQAIYSRAKAAWARQKEKRAQPGDGIVAVAGQYRGFPAIRKKMIGENLKALICGSAPLTPETQDYFSMLGIPVLQVYGLTETTGICTMDDPRESRPGRVGPAIPGIEMRLGENEEIIVRGPNVFPGYWNRPQQTAEALRDGWFHTGDQGEMDASGKLADRGANQESDHSRVGPQDCAGSRSKKKLRAICRERNRWYRGKRPRDIFRRSSPET